MLGGVEQRGHLEELQSEESHQCAIGLHIGLQQTVLQVKEHGVPIAKTFCEIKTR